VQEFSKILVFCEIGYRLHYFLWNRELYPNFFKLDFKFAEIFENELAVFTLVLWYQRYLRHS
jgi:hypothetical protein